MNVSTTSCLLAHIYTVIAKSIVRQKGKVLAVKTNKTIETDKKLYVSYLLCFVSF